MRFSLVLSNGTRACWRRACTHVHAEQIFTLFLLGVTQIAPVRDQRVTLVLLFICMKQLPHRQ